MKEIKIFDRVIYYEVFPVGLNIFGTPVIHNEKTTCFYKKIIKKRKLFFLLELLEWIIGSNYTIDYDYELLFTLPFDIDDKDHSKEIKIEIIKRIANKIL